MANLQWSAQLEQQLPAMDETHREFVQLLAQVEAASDAELPALWATVVAHTEAHFAQEERWMRESGLACDNCHSAQHHVVLALLHKGLAQAQAGDVSLVRTTTSDLVSWLYHHASTMDAALAQHLHRVGYDPDSGQMAHPQALDASAHAGCGGACHRADHAPDAAAVAHQLAQAAIAHAARAD